jgi:hypothetical protein
MNNKQLKLLKKTVSKDAKIAETAVLNYLGKYKVDTMNNIKLAAETIINQQINNDVTRESFNKILTILFNSLLDLKEIHKFQIGKGVSS